MEFYCNTFDNGNEMAHFFKNIYKMTKEKVENLQKPITQKDKRFTIEKVPQIREVHS